MDKNRSGEFKWPIIDPEKRGGDDALNEIETTPERERYDLKTVSEIVQKLESGYKVSFLNRFNSKQYKTEIVSPSGEIKDYEHNYPWPFIIPSSELKKDSKFVDRISENSKKVLLEKKQQDLFKKAFIDLEKAIGQEPKNN